MDTPEVPIEEIAAHYGVTKNAIYGRMKAGVLPIGRQSGNNGRWHVYRAEWEAHKAGQQVATSQIDLHELATLVADAVIARLGRLVIVPDARR